MAARLLAVFGTIVLVAGVSRADDLTADQYLALKDRLRATSPALSVVRADLPGYIGSVIEVAGVVGGTAKCGDSVSVLLKCPKEDVLIVTATRPQDCISNGNTVRALVRIGAASVAGLSDLRLEGAAYEYDVAVREKELAARALKKNLKAPQREVSTGKRPVSRLSRSKALSSRAMQIYEPYRNAIARFNPRLSGSDLDAITSSILAYSERYGIDPRLVVALILAESGFRVEATSPKGAMGLGQLMPGTANGLGVSNPYDPEQNIEASVRLMRGHLEKYSGQLSLALSAYNAGAGAVKKYRGIPPYRETQNYIRKVSQLYGALCGK